MPDNNTSPICNIPLELIVLFNDTDTVLNKPIDARIIIRVVATNAAKSNISILGGRTNTLIFYSFEEFMLFLSETKYRPDDTMRALSHTMFNISAIKEFFIKHEK